MRNLWIFISRYNAFFFFIFFFTVGIVLTIKNNAYQHYIAFNSANRVIGNTYKQLKNIKRYLNLGQVNDMLNEENARLKQQLLALNVLDTAKNTFVNDTVNKQRYQLIAAEVIKNSVSLTNNIITINKGAASGITKDMSVISSNKGIVGFIKDVSPHFATIRSLLNSETSVSVNLKNTNIFGSLIWGQSDFDYKKAVVKEIPNHIKVKIGDTIITSGAGRFPKGIEVGKVIKTNATGGDSFVTLELALFNDFSKLEYVYIVKDRLATEQNNLENPPKNE